MLMTPSFSRSVVAFGSFLGLLLARRLANIVAEQNSGTKTFKAFASSTGAAADLLKTASTLALPSDVFVSAQLPSLLSIFSKVSKPAGDAAAAATETPKRRYLSWSCDRSDRDLDKTGTHCMDPSSSDTMSKHVRNRQCQHAQQSPQAHTSC